LTVIANNQQQQQQQLQPWQYRVCGNKRHCK